MDPMGHSRSVQPFSTTPFPSASPRGSSHGSLARTSPDRSIGRINSPPRLSASRFSGAMAAMIAAIGDRR